MELLSECHGHIFMNGADYHAAVLAHKNGPDEALVRAYLAAYQQAGIPYLRDGGDAFGVSRRAAVLAEEYGLTYVTPIFAIHRNGRYGRIVGRGYETLADYRALVAQARQEGADFIKLMFSGILEFDAFGHLSCPSLPREEILELVHIAHGEGFPVMAHVNGPEAILAALEAGTDSIEHGYYMDSACLSALAASSSIWVPTLAATDAFAHRPGFSSQVVGCILESQFENLRRAADAGALIAAGSDAGAVGVPHGAGLRREAALLEKALGPRSEAVITQGSAAIAARFPRRGSVCPAGYQ